MRATALPLLALPLLLTYCGSSRDLVIGRVEPAGEAGTTVIPSAGVGGELPIGGSSQGGAVAVAGSGGDVTLGGASALGGTGGASPIVCVENEEPPLGSLIHRYAFDGTGDMAIDSINGQNGILQGGALLDSSGVLTLAGNRNLQPDQYVDLPDPLISMHTDLTFVAWVTWRGGAGFQRILDFGISDKGEGPVQDSKSVGRSYIAIVATSNFANGVELGAEIASPGFATLQLASDRDIQDRPSSQVALVVRSGVNVELYLDGELLISSPSPFKLSDIQDVNNWLGESQWDKDHCFHGSYDEFRIYDQALNGCQLTTLLARGPDVP